MSFYLDEIKNKYEQGKYQEAIALIEKVEQEGLITPDVLVWKGRCLQLIDEESSYQLSDIESTFKEALEIDAEFTPAIIELAWFYLNVLDDASKAIPLFDKAINLHKQLITEAVSGMAKCLLEVKTKEEAREYLHEIAHSLLDSNEIQSIIADIDST